MSVQVEDGGEGPVPLTFGNIQCRNGMDARPGLESDFADDVISTVDITVFAHFQRKSVIYLHFHGFQKFAAQNESAFLPCLQCFRQLMFAETERCLPAQGINQFFLKRFIPYIGQFRHIYILP